MENNYIVLTFEKSTKRKEYYDILMQDFSLVYLGGIELDKYYKPSTNIFYSDWCDKNSCKLFKYWEITDFSGWYKIKNKLNKNYEIEYYPTQYTILNKEKKIKFEFPLPKTINDFISDCDRCDIILYWHEDAIMNHRPINLLSEKDLNFYYDNLLNIVGKL